MRFFDGKSGIAFIALITLVLAGLLFQLMYTGIGNYPLDDAYIVDHSVTGILTGHEGRFVGSTPWQGVTSPAYLSAILLLSWFLPVGLAHWAVSALSILLLATGCYVLCRQNSLGEFTALGVAAASLTAGAAYYQLSNGIETGMAMAAMTWALIVFDHEQPPAWGYVLMGLLYFIRPELAALSVIYVIYMVTKRPEGYGRGLLTTLVVFLIFSALLWIVSGTLIPNTMSAKTYFFAEGCKPVLFKAALVISAILVFLAGLGPFAVGFILAAASGLRVVVFSFIAIFIIAYFARFPGALHHNYYRYMYLLLPVAVLGWATGLGHASRAVHRGSIWLGGLIAIYVLFSASSSICFYTDQIRTFAADNTSMAQWVAKNVPRGAVVMVHDAGEISLFGEQPLVDLVGLKSSYSEEVHRRTTFQACQRVPLAIANIAAHAGASYMVVTTDWDRIFGLTDALRSNGWTVERADKERGDSYYEVYRIFHRTS